MEKTREHMRCIGASSVDAVNNKSSTRFLRRIVKLLGKASRNPSIVVRETLRPSDELLYLIQTKSCDRKVTTEDLDLLIFLSREAGPQDVLTALGRLQLDEVDNIQPILQTLLQRAAHASESSELSVSLMKIHHARMAMKESTGWALSSTSEDSLPSVVFASSIWQSLSEGRATIAK